MPTLEQLNQEIEIIKERNKKVEAEKAWETSLIRKILIFTLTYFVIVLFFHFADLPHPFLNSIVPALAFLISTLSVPIFKKLWLRYIKK